MNLVSHFDEHESHNNDKVEYILATSMPILENCGVSREDIRLISHLMGILWYVITFLFYLPRGPNCKLVKLSDKNTNEKVSIFKKMVRWRFRCAWVFCCWFANSHFWLDLPIIHENVESELCPFDTLQDQCSHTAPPNPKPKRAIGSRPISPVFSARTQLFIKLSRYRNCWWPICDGSSRKTHLRRRTSKHRLYQPPAGKPGMRMVLAA